MTRGTLSTFVFFSWGPCNRLNCARATFYAYARPFNVVTNILRILTVIFHTEEGLYT